MHGEQPAQQQIARHVRVPDVAVAGAGARLNVGRDTDRQQVCRPQQTNRETDRRRCHRDVFSLFSVRDG